jgi:hypothetical protein
MVSNRLPSLDCQVVWQRGFQPSVYIWFFPNPLSSKFSRWFWRVGEGRGPLLHRVLPAAIPQNLRRAP